ncbi:MAG: apolipoprotein N-acyltransferase [Desulfobulbus oligotrophicus]|nr:apolipoprotein N-acyltransferase [Desulfobulbus oligotrophicus]
MFATQTSRPRTEVQPNLLWAALVSAALSALAMPGKIGWWPLLFVALVPLLRLCLNDRPLRSVAAGFLFGVVYHLALLYWILIVLGQYGDLPLWVSLPALVLLASYMAGYCAVFCGLLSLLAGRAKDQERSAVAFVWIAPLFWVGLDYLRSVLFTGFPWMDLGYGLFSQPWLIQAADLGGHHLLTFFLVLGNCLLVAALDWRQYRSRYRQRSERRLLLTAGVLFVAVIGYSLVRYHAVATTINHSLQARVAVVQGNIDQAIKWSPAIKAETVDTYLRLSRQVLDGEAAQLIIWPETALPFYPQQDTLIGKVIGFTTDTNTWLFTGAPLYSVTVKKEGEEEIRYYNGSILIGPEGKVGGEYNKQHLVPFGEYVPLRRYLPFLQPLVVNIGDFSAGTVTGPLPLGPLWLGVLICYESIFPDIAATTVKKGANMLVNLTNDAWYGRSSAPYQSMAMAVFRAVENKRSLVRAANTGISGFIDPVGHIMVQTEIFTEAAQAADVPVMNLQTVFTWNGSYFGLICAVLMPFFLLLNRYRARS